MFASMIKRGFESASRQQVLFRQSARASFFTVNRNAAMGATNMMFASQVNSMSGLGSSSLTVRTFAEGGDPTDSSSTADAASADKRSADFQGQPSYIKEMKENRDWQDALENRERPVMIQAGASWCGPCNILKPMLIDAVKAHEGKIEYLYVDIDEHQNIAQLLRIQHVPVVYLVRDGNLMDTFSGVPEDSQKIEDFIQKGFVKLEPLKVEPQNEGSGEVVPKGSQVKVHYTGKLLDGTVFDSSHNRGEPIEFKVGMGQVIPAWDQGICQLKKGQKAILTCPPHLAYGSQGAGDSIPPNSTLIFEVEVVDFTPPAQE